MLLWTCGSPPVWAIIINQSTRFISPVRTIYMGRDQVKVQDLVREETDH